MIVTSNQWRRTGLISHQRPKSYYEFAVSGYGAFPFDMLINGQCWPAGVDDAENMVPGYQRVVNLISYRQPDPSLWESHRWPLVEKEPS